MPRKPTASYAVSEPPPKRDFELCKVVFGAAISQVLFSRRALPPECFQLLPLAEVLSRSFEDIIASGSEIHVHDNELLREQASTLFLRQGQHYGLNRFLGILREDIFPLIENEGLVKFRISYLRTKAWSQSSLIEYYTVAFKYEQDGSYVLDIWRAGTGTQHTATTDSQLWNLGDYLSRLPAWEEPLHWTLAFHATERPDDPPIGVWKFDRTDFDDANLELQQRAGYAYVRVARLEIMPLPLAGVDEVIPETSADLEPELPVRPVSKHKVSDTVRQGREPKAARLQLSPPTTLASNRNVSKNANADNENRTVVTRNMRKEISRGAESARNLRPRKGLVTKRKPKRPLQLFEYAASSLPPTQIIGESQSLSQAPPPPPPPPPPPAPRKEASPLRHEKGNGSDQERYKPDVLRSPFLDPSRLLDDISLSSEAVSATQSSPRVGLPQLPPPFPKIGTSMDMSRRLLRLGPSSVLGGNQDLTQHEPPASPPQNVLGIELSDDEEETASEAEPETSPGSEKGARGASAEKGITYDFSPHTVKRRTSLFYDISAGSSGDEE